MSREHIFDESKILKSLFLLKNNTKFNKNHNDINNVIEFISSIRSTKAELKVTPKLFFDVYFVEKSSKLNLLVNNHIALVKQVGRINNILKEKESEKRKKQGKRH